MEGYIQQDAHELMTLLLEDINMELNENNNNIKYKQINYSNKKSKKICNDEFKNFLVEDKIQLLLIYFIYN